jgi:hypothetical protein
VPELVGGVSVIFDLVVWLDIDKLKVTFKAMATFYDKQTIFLCLFGHISDAKTTNIVLAAG